MRILVTEMPKKKEECLFYRKVMRVPVGCVIEIRKDCCSLNNKHCSFKNGDSIFGGECRCLKTPR